jgi:predicted thioesterase
MILFIERTARKLLEDHLPPGLSSVGAHLDVRHLAPTPVGSRVVAHVEVVAVEGNRIKFNVQAHDPHEQVGVGSHIRYVIDEAQFLRRVEEKA